MYVSIPNKAPVPLCTVCFLPSHVWCVGTMKLRSVGLFSAVFGSMCFLVNASGRQLVEFTTETNLHGWRLKCGLVATDS